jgi:hypothetical protein
MSTYINYNNEKDTLPKSTAVADVEADFDALGGRLIHLTSTAAGSPAEPPTASYIEGDYIVCLAQNYVGMVTRVVDDNVLEVFDEHGLTASGVVCAKIPDTGGFLDYSFLVGSGGAALLKGQHGDVVIFPADSSDGGNGFSDDDYFPIIIDAATNSTTVVVKAIH